MEPWEENFSTSGASKEVARKIFSRHYYFFSTCEKMLCFRLEGLPNLDVQREVKTAIEPVIFV